MGKAISKKEMSKKSLSECLSLIYNNVVLETAIQDIPKRVLEDYILEIFNKGVLNDYHDLF